MIITVPKGPHAEGHRNVLSILGSIVKDRLFFSPRESGCSHLGGCSISEVNKDSDGTCRTGHVFIL